MLRSWEVESFADAFPTSPGVLLVVLDRIEAGIVPLLACGFFAVLFLQSGIDKITDRKGNLEWMVPHFEKSPFKGMVPLLLSLLTFLEVGTGLACAGGFVLVLIGVEFPLVRYALWSAAGTLLCLFAGQRLSKDYAGAASLAAYFAVALLGVWGARGI